MKGINILLLVFLSILPYGCTEAQKREMMMKDMQNSIAELKKVQSENSIRIEELNNKVFLLQEKFNIISKEVDDIKAMAIPTKPPDELKIVKMMPEDAIKQEPKIEERKEETKKIESKETLKADEVKPVQQTQKEEKVPEPETFYREAQDLYAAGKLEDAVSSFRRFIKHYPKNPLADNAQYWIGEAYYTNNDFAKAIAEFKKVVDRYPDENKAPDAMLKIGLSYLGMGEKNKAVESFKKVIDKYPKSDAAEKAKEKLKEK